MLAARDRRLQRRNGSLNCIDRGDDVRARLTEDQHVHGRLPIEEARLANRLLGINDVGNILQPNSAPVVVADDERLVGFRLRYLIIREYVRGRISDAQLSLRGVRVLPGDHLLYRGQADAVTCQLVRIQLDAHSRKRRSYDRYLTDPGDLRDALLDDSGSLIVEGWNVVDVRLQAQHHDRRVCRIHLAIGRIRRKIGGQI